MEEGLFYSTAWRRKRLELEPIPLKVLESILTYMNVLTGKSFPSVSRISADIGRGRQTVTKAIADLVVMGYIEVEKKTSKNNTYMHNVYTVVHWNKKSKKLMINKENRDDIIKKYTNLS